MSKESILIIDDNPINLKLARVLLTAAGYVVAVAGAAEEALATLATCHPDIILMDIQLPDIDGLELTRRLKATPELCDIIVVALTAFAMKGDAQKARDAGCSGYISKPIDTRTFANEVASYLTPERTAIFAAEKLA